MEQLIWEVRRVFRELTTVADQELQTVGIRTGDRAFLEFLARESQPVSLSGLARKYSVSRQHIHQTLRDLPNPDWVDKTRDASDDRTVLLSLSPKGRRIWNRIREVDRRLLSKLAGRLPRESVATTTDLLGLLRHELAARKEIEK